MEFIQQKPWDLFKSVLTLGVKKKKPVEVEVRRSIPWLGLFPPPRSDYVPHWSWLGVTALLWETAVHLRQDEMEMAKRWKGEEI